MDQKNFESEEEIFFEYEDGLDEKEIKKESDVEEFIWEVEESPEIKIKQEPIDIKVKEEPDIEDRIGSPDLTQNSLDSQDLSQNPPGSPDLTQEIDQSPDLTQQLSQNDENSDLVFIIEEDDIPDDPKSTPEEFVKDAIKFLYDNSKQKSSNKIEKQRKMETSKIEKKGKEQNIDITKWSELLNRKERSNNSISNWEYTLQALQLEEAFSKLNIRRRYIPQSQLSFPLALEDQIHLYNCSNPNNISEKFNVEKICELCPIMKSVDVPDYRYIIREFMYLLLDQGFNLGFVILSVNDQNSLIQGVNVEIIPPIDDDKDPIYFWISRNHGFFDSIVFTQRDNSFVEKISDISKLRITEVYSPDSWSEKAGQIQQVINKTKDEAKSKSIISNNFMKVINSWEDRLNHIVNQKITTVFVGESRHGKSTLINCLLGDRILPTSADIACTSSIIEICYGENHIVEVDVFSKEEWTEYYNNLLDLLDRGENIQEVHSILSSVFGSEKNWKNELPFQISRELSSNTKRFQVKDSSEIQKYLKTYCTTKDKENGCQIWPIVKRVRIHGPFPILKEGLNFVDLPGLHDVNTAREKITKTYIQNARYLMVCSNYASLSSSPTIRDIIQISIANGTKITFCVTMIDAINYSDVSSNHELPDAEPYKVIIYETNRLQMLSQNIIFEEMEKFYKNLIEFRKKEISSVPFFAVSGMEYNEFKRKKNKYPEILNGINRLCNFIQDLANIKLIDLKHLVNHISEFKLEEKTSDIDTEKIKKEKTEFLNEIQGVIENKVKETFNNRLIQSSKEAYDQSFQAILARNGRYTNAKKEIFDLDQDLGKPIIECISSLSSSFFGHGVPGIGNSIVSQTIDQIFSILFIKKELGKIMNQTNKLNEFKIKYKRLIHQQLHESRVLVIDNIKDLINSQVNYKRILEITDGGTGKRDRLLKNLSNVMINNPFIFKNVIDGCFVFFHKIIETFNENFKIMYEESMNSLLDIQDLEKKNFFELLDFLKILIKK